MQAAPAGAMVAVPLGEDRVREMLRGRDARGPVDRGGQRAVAMRRRGAAAGIEAFEDRLRDEAVTYQRLLTGGAFHSPLMAGVVEPLTAAAREVRDRAAADSVRVERDRRVDHGGGRARPGYWGRHARSTVRFRRERRARCSRGARLSFSRSGPGQALSSLVRQLVTSHGRTGRSDCRDHCLAAVGAGHRCPTASQCRAGARAPVAVGIVPDWPAYHAGERRLRVELPTYPFERKRYWADPVRRDAVSTRSSRRRRRHRRRAESGRLVCDPVVVAIAAALRDVDDRVPDAMARVCWMSPTPAALTCRVARASRPRDRPRSGRAAPSPAHVGVHDRIPPRGATTTRSVPTCVPSDRLPTPCSSLACCRARPISAGVAPTTPSRKRVRRAGSSACCIWRRRGATSRDHSSLQVVVVSDPIHDVTGPDDICPEKATVLGAVRVLPQEYPSIGAVASSTSRRAMRALRRAAVDQIVAELESDATEPWSPTAASIDGFRRLSRFASTASEQSPRLLRDGGVYLITGGYGAIGLEIARYLASSVQPKLVLVGPRRFPGPRAVAEAHVALHGRDDEVSRKIRSVQALEESGADVIAARADVASETQMRDVVARTRDAASVASTACSTRRASPAAAVMQLRKPRRGGGRDAAEGDGHAGARARARRRSAGFHVAVLVAQRPQRRRGAGRLLRGQRLSGRLRPLPDACGGHVHDLGELGYVARSRNGRRRARCRVVSPRARSRRSTRGMSSAAGYRGRSAMPGGTVCRRSSCRRAAGCDPRHAGDGDRDGAADAIGADPADDGASAEPAGRASRRRTWRRRTRCTRRSATCGATRSASCRSVWTTVFSISAGTRCSPFRSSRGSTPISGQRFRSPSSTRA